MNSQSVQPDSITAYDSQKHTHHLLWYQKVHYRDHKNPANGSYPDVTNPHSRPLFPHDPTLIVSFHQDYYLQTVSSLTFPTKVLYSFNYRLIHASYKLHPHQVTLYHAEFQVT